MRNFPTLGLSKSTLIQHVQRRGWKKSRKTLTMKSSLIISSVLLKLPYFLLLMTGHSDITIIPLVSVLGFLASFIVSHFT